MLQNLKYYLKFGIVIQNSRIPKWLSLFINIKAITLYPFIIFRHEADEKTINHERIHITQQKELFVIPFYVLYVLFWLWNIVFHKDDTASAYYNIPFEVEAYQNDDNFTYLFNRKMFAWKDFFINRSGPNC